MILCWWIGCAPSQQTTTRAEPASDPCTMKAIQLQGPKLTEAQYRDAIGQHDLAAVGGHLASAVVEQPENPVVHRSFALHLGEVGDVEGSVTHYRCALKLDPRLPATRIELGAQLVSAEAWADAQAELLKAQQESSPDFRSRSLMATALEGLGQIGAAADELARAAEETKTSAVLYRRAADLYQRAGDSARAAELKSKADELDPPPEQRKMRPLREAKRPPKNR